MFRSAGFVCLLFAVVANAAEVPEAPVMPRAVSTVSVDCNNGESIQAAVDANPSPIEIQISGICTENVLIRDKDVMLRGTTKPALDGIRSAIRATPALTIRGPVIGVVENLSFSKSAGSGVAVRGANVAFTNCLFQNNGTNGLVVNLGGLVTANGLTFDANAARAINVSDAQFFCTGCDVSGNNALIATRGAIVSLLDSVVTGGNGIFAADGGTFADLDCVTVNSSHPCLMDVTGFAVRAADDGAGALIATGDFRGQVLADNSGAALLVGARQLATNATGDANFADFFGRIVVSAFDGTPAMQSRLRSTTGEHFAQILVTDQTILDGTVMVSTSAMQQIDPTVIILPPR